MGYRAGHRRMSPNETVLNLNTHFENLASRFAMPVPFVRSGAVPISITTTAAIGLSHFKVFWDTQKETRCIRYSATESLLAVLELFDRFRFWDRETLSHFYYGCAQSTYTNYLP